MLAQEMLVVQMFGDWPRFWVSRERLESHRSDFFDNYGNVSGFGGGRGGGGGPMPRSSMVKNSQPAT